MALATMTQLPALIARGLSRDHAPARPGATRPQRRAPATLTRWAAAALLFAAPLGLGCSDDVDSSDAVGWRSWTAASAGGVNGSLYTPSSPGVVGQGRSLLVVLHGCAQTGDDLRNFGTWIDTAEDFGMVVSLPNVPNGGVFAGCWDYYGPSHARTSGQPQRLLAHVDALLAEPSLDIDPDQVYIAGLSSGAGMAMVMGCLAPDVFAGFGVVAGPTVGTSAFQISSVGTNAAQGRATCEALAGSASPGFATQLSSMVAGTGDFIVAQGYAPLNAEVMASIYADAAGLGSLDSSSLAVGQLPGTGASGTGQLRGDGLGPRVSLLSIQGLGHAWPAGGGSGGSFVAGQGLDYARYLAEFFGANNRRIDASSGGDGGTTGDGDGDGDAGTTGDGDGDGDTGTTGDGDGDTGTTGDGDGDGDGDGEGEGDGDTGGCDPWVATATDVISGHLSRFATYPAGYGAADVTYLSLFFTFGVNTPFTLYEGIDNNWYFEPANLPAGNCP